MKLELHWSYTKPFPIENDNIHNLDVAKCSSYSLFLFFFLISEINRVYFPFQKSVRVGVNYTATQKRVHLLDNIEQNGDVGGVQNRVAPLSPTHLHKKHLPLDFLWKIQAKSAYPACSMTIDPEDSDEQDNPGDMNFDDTFGVMPGDEQRSHFFAQARLSELSKIDVFGVLSIQGSEKLFKLGTMPPEATDDFLSESILAGHGGICWLKAIGTDGVTVIYQRRKHVPGPETWWELSPAAKDLLRKERPEMFAYEQQAQTHAQSFVDPSHFSQPAPQPQAPWVGGNGKVAVAMGLDPSKQQEVLDQQRREAREERQFAQERSIFTEMWKASREVENRSQKAYTDIVTAILQRNGGSGDTAVVELYKGRIEDLREDKKQLQDAVTSLQKEINQLRLDLLKANTELAKAGITIQTQKERNELEVRRVKLDQEDNSSGSSGAPVHPMGGVLQMALSGAMEGLGRGISNGVAPMLERNLPRLLGAFAPPQGQGQGQG